MVRRICSDFCKEACEIFELNAYSKDVVKYKLFCQTLTNESYVWLKNCPADITDTWNELASTVLTQCYPDSKSYGARRMVANFKKHQVQRFCH
jgi:hypothetical protein